MTFALLLAAGASERFFASLPESLKFPENSKKIPSKLFWEIVPGVPLWKISYESLRKHPLIEGVGIVCRQEDEHEFENVGAAFVVTGGDTRTRSCKKGLQSIPQEVEWILVHDAARPFVSSALIERVIHAAEKHGAAIPAIPVWDCLKKVADTSQIITEVRETIPREGIYLAQTPQVARKDWMESALNVERDYPDEAAALEAAGFPIQVVMGESTNLKVTTYSDFQVIQKLATEPETSVGIGYDVHSFSDDPSRGLVLGGVAFPGHAGLRGHSDADVILHALTDAILGACGLGDIGQHFPDSDPKWKDAKSSLFVEQAVEWARKEGWSVSHTDITLLAEEPRISDKRETIRERVASLLRIEKNRVNIKATTSEGIGAIGRREGIAALAVVTLNRKDISV
ncbi:MAG TPA: 2-C-methyl-D-erythritol 2,4-cyclodiphosphate synthase [Fimbriimonadales bacterium]|nr:2-C-methyl-D-erythritol 2,4-cyclodiphosphate synthase [Fimbriimonadales bacterium]